VMPTMVKGDDVRSGTKQNTLIVTSYGWHRQKWVKELFS